MTDPIIPGNDTDLRRYFARHVLDDEQEGVKEVIVDHRVATFDRHLIQHATEHAHHQLIKTLCDSKRMAVAMLESWHVRDEVTQKQSGSFETADRAMTYTPLGDFALPVLIYRIRALVYPMPAWPWPRERIR